MKTNNLGSEFGSVLFFTSNSILGFSGFTQQFLLEAKVLKKRGVNVIVLAFCHPKLLWLNRKRNIYKKILNKEKIKYHVIPIMFSGRSIVGPIIEFLYTILLTMIILRYKVKIIHAHNQNTIRLALLLRRFLNVKNIYDIHGIPVEESVYEVDPSEYSKMYLKLIEMQSQIIKKSDFVFCVSEPMKKYLISMYGAKESKIIITPTSIDTKKYDYKKENKIRAKSKLGLKGKFIVVSMWYSGAWQIFEKSIDFFLMTKCKIQNSHFLILTANQDAENILIEKNINKKDYSIFTVFPHQLNEYLLAADAGLLLRDQSIVNKVAAPVKFGEYLASGTPVVITKGIGDTEKIINKFGVGVIISGLHESALDMGVKKLLNLYKVKGDCLFEDCKKAANSHLSIDMCIEKFLNVYDTITSR